MPNIANAAKLLSDIAEGLKELEKQSDWAQNSASGSFTKGRVEIKLVHINVTFYETEHGEEHVTWNGSLSEALLNLSNDTYWDEGRNWALADHASVSYG